MAAVAASGGIRGALSWLGSIPKNYPMTFGAVFSGAKTSFADWLVQKYVEKRKPEDFDYNRNLAFTSFGIFYLGGVQYALYVPIFKRMFPYAQKFVEKPAMEKLRDSRGLMTMGAQVFVDQAIHHPFLYFPVFYAVKETIGMGITPGRESLETAFKKYRANLSEDVQALWKVWVPAMIFNFSFCPMYMRIPCVATTSLLWTMILSYMRGNDDHLPALDAIFTDLNRIHFLDKRALSRSEPDMQKAHIVITATGKEAGDDCVPTHLLPSVTQRILEYGGNVQESRVAILAGELAVIIVADCPHNTSKQMQNELKQYMKRKDNGFLDVRFRSLDASKVHQESCKELTGHFKLSAFDRPGIVFNVTNYLEKRGVRIVDLTCEQKDADIDGVKQSLFFMEGTMKADTDCTNHDMVKKSFDSLQKELKVKTELMLN